MENHPQIWPAPKNILMKLYPLLCIPCNQQYILPWEVAREVSHLAGTCLLIFLWLLNGTQSLKDENSNQWKSHKKKPKALLIGLCPSTKGTTEKMETLQVRWKDKCTIQSPTDTCKWYFDSRVKTRHLRETQHKKGYTVQRAHSHKIRDVQTTGY